MVNTGQNRVKKAKGILGKKAENVASRDERSRVKTAASAKQAETPSVKAKDRPGVKVKSVTPRDERSRVRLAVDEDIHDFPVENDVPAESRTERDHAKKAKGIVLDKDETVYVGVDVHLRSYSVAVWSVQQGKVVTCWTQPAEMEKLLDRLAPVKAHVAQVVYEAGPTGYCLVRRLRAEGFQAELFERCREGRDERQRVAESGTVLHRQLPHFGASHGGERLGRAARTFLHQTPGRQRKQSHRRAEEAARYDRRECHQFRSHFLFIKSPIA